mmetsp:Transcript_41471/g.96447  ORF Transcript_41471/g.96447 Transcript_41471/m.96447 type:complete len:355 (+) Transcript_41471:44-1108(+)
MDLMNGRPDVQLWPPVRRPHELRRALWKGILVPTVAAFLCLQLRLLATSGSIGDQVWSSNSTMLISSEENDDCDHPDSLQRGQLEDPSAPELQTVELQEDKRPWQVTRWLVPLAPEVALWWNNTNCEFNIRAARCQTPPGQDSRIDYLRLQVQAAQPFQYQGRTLQAIQTTVILPKGTVLKECSFSWITVTVDLPHTTAGTVRGLRLTCPVSPRGFQGGSFSGILALAIFAWLLMPWPLLLLPTTIMYTAARPLALGAALFLSRLSRCLRRQRRVWRLSSMVRRIMQVNVAYGEGDPCCICFGAVDEASIALLPCRHSLHASCYRSWICTDSYPSRDLICPICRRKVTGVGKLV